MTPQEKALELYNSNIKLFKHYDANPKLNIGLHNYFKQSTLIAVDEIILEMNNVMVPNKYYWQEVKQEIEKL
jgi:hypothetical protein